MTWKNYAYIAAGLIVIVYAYLRYRFPYSKLTEIMRRSYTDISVEVFAERNLPADAFLGLGLVIVHPKLTQGTVIGTAQENLNGAYVPATGGDLAQAFQLTADPSGLVGMTHKANSNNASIDTLLFCSVVFYPELLDGVFKASIGPEGATGATGATGAGTGA